jgi:uncharacterized protein YjbI with pentapeptide repeats
MNLIQYDTTKFLKNADNRHKAFFFHYYTADKEIFEQATKRWQGRKDDLKDIADDIIKGSLTWQCKEIFNNDRNLNGLELNKFHSKKPLQSLYYTSLEYCVFNAVKIDVFDDTKDKIHHDQPPVFLGSKLNHSFFKNCSFHNVSFMNGEFQNIVFYNCIFENVIFNKQQDGLYKNIFFQNCDFINVDVENLEFDSFCFWGECSFDGLNFGQDTFPKKGIIGRNIIDICRKLDEESFETRKKHRYIGGYYNKIEIETISEEKSSEKVIKYASMKNCYEGLIELYKHVFEYEEKFGEHGLYLRFNYIYKWLMDERDRLINKKNIKRRIFISRTILGYGIKAEKPLIAYLFMILIFSFLYLFTGLKIDNHSINHKSVLDFIESNQTIYDYGYALYFSVVTSTTIGFGDIRPASGITMLLACIQGLLGIFLTTMFTVVFGRRFFK